MKTLEIRWQRLVDEKEPDMRTMRIDRERTSKGNSESQRIPCPNRDNSYLKKGGA